MASRYRGSRHIPTHLAAHVVGELFDVLLAQRTAAAEDNIHIRIAGCSVIHRAERPRQIVDMGVRPLHAKSVCKCIQIVNLEEVAAVFPGPDGIEPDLSGSGPAVGLCGRGEIVAHLRETARSIQRQVADQAASVWKGIGLRTSWLTHGTSSLLPPPQRGVFPIIMQTAENVEMPAGSCRNCRRRAGRFCNQNEMVFAKWA